MTDTPPPVTEAPPPDHLATAADVGVEAYLRGCLEGSDGSPEAALSVWAGGLAAVCRFLYENAAESAQAADLAHVTATSAEGFMVALAAKTEEG